MAKLPRGIQIVKWDNDDKSKSVRYRVRIQRKTFEADRHFDTQPEAEKFLADSKSQAGRKAIIEQSAADMARVNAIKEFLVAPPLSYYLDEWAKRKLPSEEQAKTLTDAKRKGRSVALNRIEVVKRVNVEFVTELMRPAMTGVFAGSSILPKKPFGDFKIAEFSQRTASSYIEARLADGVSPSTVKRDVSFLSSFFGTWLPEFDERAAAKLGGNPFSGQGDKGKLKNADKRRDTRVADFGEDAETRLITELRNCRNPQMLQIVSLGLSTGMRRGEILALTWDRVKGNHIQLLAIDTKNGKPRRIPISEETKKVLATVARDEEKPDARLFSYTSDGFKSVWHKVRVRAKLDGLRFHDLRHEFISRLLEVISSPIAAAAVSGYANIKHFARQHVQPYKDRLELENGIETERGVVLAAGHADNRMTADYASKIGEKVMVAADNARRAAASSIAYPIIIDAEEGSVAVYSPDFSVSVSAETEDQAMILIASSIEKWMLSGNPLPKPSLAIQVARQFPGAFVKMIPLG